MRILLKLILDCTPDAAWTAIRSPEVFRAVSAPFLRFDSLEPDGFPGSWSAGEHPVSVRVLGLIPAGEQIIRISFPEGRAGVRAVRDTGGAVSGPLTVITRWDHTMAVSSARGDRTLYRDQLVVEAGVLTPLLWIAFWAFWQWRAAGLRRFAPAWRA